MKEQGTRGICDMMWWCVLAEYCVDWMPCGWELGLSTCGTNVEEQSKRRFPSQAIASSVLSLSGSGR